MRHSAGAAACWAPRFGTGSAALLGVAGARILLAFIVLLLAVWISNVSVKKLIGWLVIACSKVRLPKMRVALPDGHGSLAKRSRFPVRRKSLSRSSTRVRARRSYRSRRSIPPVAATIVVEDEREEDEPEDGDPEDGDPEDEYLEVSDCGRVRSAGRSRAWCDRVPPSGSRALRSAAGAGSRRLEPLTRARRYAREFGVGAKVVHIERGPSITRYELKPERGVKISKIASLADDLALALAATSVRIEAPIPGKSAVGIEVPNQDGFDRRDPRDSRSAAATAASSRRSGWRSAKISPDARFSATLARCRICSSRARRAPEIGLPEYDHRLAAGQRYARSSAVADDRSQARRAHRVQRHPASHQGRHHRSRASPPGRCSR